LSIAALAVQFGSTVVAQDVTPQLAATRVYDDFTKDFLNPNRWQPESLQGFGRLDLVRLVDGGKLSWLHRIAGDTSSDTGTRSGADHLVMIQRPGTIREIRFDAFVKSYFVGHCPVAGSGPSTAALVAEAALFNDGTPGDPDAGNIVAGIGLLRGLGPALPLNRLNVAGYLYHQTNGLIGSVVLGTIPRNVTATMRMRWVPETNIVEYQFGENPTQTIAYAGDDSVLRTRRSLGIQLNAANCSAERQYASMDVLIDNVIVND
jgi:hypothetical protein